MINGAPDWLVPEAFRRLTPNRYSKAFQAGRIAPVELVVYHFTAGGFDGSIRWLTSKDSSASAHFIVRKNGELWQLAPLTDRCFHAGGQTSSWRGKGQVNNRSIGIEIENWGKLKTRKKPDGSTEVLTYKDLPQKDPVFTAADGALWDAYTEVQLVALEKLTQDLVRAFSVLGEASGPPDGRLVGHEHVDGSRKSDPGPGFPWPRILAAATAARAASVS